MIVRVVPLLRLPRNLHAFDYLLTERLEALPGSLVVVPFRKRATLGIVIDRDRNAEIRPYQLLRVTTVLSLQPLLPRFMLSAAIAVAQEEFTSLATVLRSILPSFRLNELLRLPLLQEQFLSRSVLALLNHRTNTTGGIGLVTYLRERIILQLYQQIIQPVLDDGRSVILVTPTVADVMRLSKHLPPSRLFHHGIGLVALRNVWTAIRSESASFVIGTRSAVFSPVQNLGLIIVHNEDADEHVQEEPSPHFDVRRVARNLTEQHGAKLVLTSRYPSLISFHLTRTAEHSESAMVPRPIFVNLDQHRDNRDYRMVPQETLDTLSRAVQSGLNSLIIHHHRSFFSSLMCSDCGYIPSCRVCRVPLMHTGNTLQCRHCLSTEPIPELCPRCGGHSLRGRGKGIPHLTQELRKTFGNRVTSSRPDALPQRGMIFVVTPPDLHLIPDELCSLGVLTRLESLLSVPRVDASERTRRLATTLYGKLFSVHPTLIVQAGSHYKTFVDKLFDRQSYHEEFDLRERFGYPPAWKLLVLRKRLVSRTKGIEAGVVCRKLRTISTDLVVTGPRRSLGRSRTNPGGSVVVVRYRSSLPVAARSLLQNLDESWSISLDPVEIW